MSRVRVVTPELLDGAVAALINTNGTASRSAAVSAGAGGGTVTATGVTTATPNTLVQRDAAGRTQFVSPAVSADAATKGYVDTTVAGYVPNASLAAPSGVATLDGSSFLTTAQVPQYLHQHRGSGTAFPTGIRVGDTYLHTGIGCLFSYNGTGWKQAEEFGVANMAGRDALISNYATSIHLGFRVWQTDLAIEWVWNGAVWVPTAPGQLQGKLYGAGVATTGTPGTGGVGTFVPLPVFRGSGGFTSPGAGYMVLPAVDGMYSIKGRGYLTNAGSGQAGFVIMRTRTGVADATASQSDIIYKASTGVDQDSSWGETVPLKAGDKIWMQCFSYSGSTGMAFYYNRENFGSSIGVTYSGPLNGATPL